MQIELVKCDVNVLELTPSAKIIVKVPGTLPVEAIKALRGKLLDFFGVPNERLLLMDSLLDVTVAEDSNG